MTALTALIVALAGAVGGVVGSLLCALLSCWWVDSKCMYCGRRRPHETSSRQDCDHRFVRH